MITVKIICVGKLKEKFYTDAASEYAKRLAGYCKLEIVELPESRISVQDDSQISIALEKERGAIEARIPTGAAVIALCIEGRELDSLELSRMICDTAVQGTSKLCFILGGSVGIHEKIKSMSDFRLSMSKMTFPHNLARIMLLEQLYRAFKIAEGGKYHK